MDARQITEAFSSHRFEEAIPRLAPTVRCEAVAAVDAVGRHVGHAT